MNELDQSNKIKIFLSYATKDTNVYPIKQIAKSLEEGGDVKTFFWEEDAHDNIIQYMDENVGKCDAFILFCSPNALISEPIIKEWTAADSINKPIIPVFFDDKYIPPLLKSRRGIKFNPFVLKESVNELMQVIRNKINNNNNGNSEIIEKGKILEREKKITKSEIFGDLGNWADNLKDLLNQELPPAVIKTFILKGSQNQKQTFLNSFLTQIPPVSLDKIYEICKLFPNETNTFFSDQNNYPFFESILAMNDGSQLESQDPNLAKYWDRVRSKKWQESFKELTKMVSQIFSLKEEIAIDLINSVIIPDLYFVDEKWGIKSKTEQEREQLIKQLIKNKEEERRNEIVDYHGTPLSRYNYDIMITLDKLVGEIPKVSVVTYNTFGFAVHENHIVQLGLNNKKLTSLPECICKLTSLIILIMNYNHLTSLPNSIGGLTSLKELRLDNNKLSSLPEGIGDLTLLKKLYLDSNQLTSLPESFCILSKLDYLNLSNNQLSSLPNNIGDITSLKELLFQYNKLTSLPNSIGELTSLKKLSFHSNQLISLPESICNLSSLDYLSLNTKLLTTVPTMIKNWIKYLKKHGCQVRKS
ncbi:MAG: leucine-rich repeat domain-containing protein [Promethearchaeota archaeon]